VKAYGNDNDNRFAITPSIGVFTLLPIKIDSFIALPAVSLQGHFKLSNEYYICGNVGSVFSSSFFYPILGVGIERIINENINIGFSLPTLPTIGDLYKPLIKDFFLFVVLESEGSQLISPN